MEPEQTQQTDPAAAAATPPSDPTPAPAPAAPTGGASLQDVLDKLNAQDERISAINDRLDNAMTVSPPEEDQEVTTIPETPAAPGEGQVPQNPSDLTTHDQGGTPTPVGDLADDDPRKPAGLIDSFFNG